MAFNLLAWRLPTGLSLVLDLSRYGDCMRKSLVVPILLMVLMAGCSSGANQAAAPPSSPSDANANAAASIGENESPAAPSAPSATPTAPVQPAKPEVKPNRNADHTLAPNARPGGSAVASDKGPAPKLVLPVNKIDFGQVYQNVSLTRKLVVKNGGNAELKIESVVPS